ncbi:hypothetical protein Dsin_025928 [Dipteronia sinensis]|uniref:Uncharacterized protein n=1 Tax=Dipteronia sinensis TaxID=43782 RepID=A0AAD9ZY64_9ROSI|nr:hypothetical protein Dsin_025928 [Dipteronia sinensis]
MARQIRETEGKEQSLVDEDEQEEPDVDGEFPDEIKVIEEHREGDVESPSKVASFDNGAVQASSASSAEVLKDRQKINQDGKSSSYITVTKEVVQSSDTHDGKSCTSESNSIKTKPRVIRSVKEAGNFFLESVVTRI